MTADASGPSPSPDTGGAGPTRPPLTDAQKSLRAQMLATEHWSLLASRSTTQSEVLTRIAIFLTLVSAGLVTLGVLGNATAFRGWFGVAALGVLFLLVLLGLITQLRVFNTATEDLVYVLAMNRLRAAYVDLDPGIEPYFMMGTADDREGVDRTYYAFDTRSRTQVLGSSMMLILVVHAALVGLFAGALTYAIASSVGAAIVLGSVVVVVVFGAWMAWGYRGYRQVQRLHEPLRQTGAGHEPAA
jgi:membrane protein YdbS with pleckstrin-like domain